jgi:plastocyanin
MSKNLKSSLVLIAFLGVIFLGVFGTFWVGKNATRHEKAEVVECTVQAAGHTVEIKDGKVIPQYLDAKVCDKLTIINRDDRLRLIAFGVHDDHIYYNGITEKVLKKDQSLSVTLNQTGVYLFHDHIQDEVQGQFNVQ